VRHTSNFTRLSCIVVISARLIAWEKIMPLVATIVPDDATGATVAAVDVTRDVSDDGDPPVFEIAADVTFGFTVGDPDDAEPDPGWDVTLTGLGYTRVGPWDRGPVDKQGYWGAAVEATDPA
jgi:hypothetical protein